MNINLSNLDTPLYIYNANTIRLNAERVEKIARKNSVIPIYALKALCFADTNSLIHDHVDGFAASSLNEVILATEELKGNGSIHFTAPGIRPDEIDKLCKLCDYLAFNSLNQWDRFKKIAINQTSPGLRVNPQMSFIDDRRYNPCATHSKLGVPLRQLIKIITDEPDRLSGLKGIHFHTNSEATDFLPLLRTVNWLDKTIGTLLEQVSWINLGGGYYFDEDTDYSPFEEAIRLLKTKYDLDVIIEPGAAIIQESGNLISEVIDIFESDGKKIAVLDATVNHAPEVFEYQYSPDVIGHTDSGEYEYILAGCSCLAGDLFGEYCFNEPLEIGSRVVFTDMAAYSLVKANMFNGINLPSIYKCSKDGSIELIKEYTYQDYRSRLGETTSETSRERDSNTSNQESSKVISLSRG